MPLTLPDLDDRRYVDLVEEARAFIPTYAPEWTDHNASDPGITLIEMFAYLSEMLIYRLNRVTDANRRAFLRLLTGPNHQLPDGDERTLDEQIRDAVLSLRQPYRAVTTHDFERLALTATGGRVARVRCVENRNLDSENPLAHEVERPGHMSLILVPEPAFGAVLVSQGGAFTDYTGAAGGEGAVELPGDSTERLYVGSDSPFAGIEFRFRTAGRGYDLRFEYSAATESGWSRLSAANHALEDRTNKWSVGGLVEFAPPDDWVRKRVSDGSGDLYWVRVGTTSTSSPNPTAVASHIAGAFGDVRGLVSKVEEYLDPRRLLTTHVHAVGPRFATLGVQLTLVLAPDVLETDTRLQQAIRSRAAEAVERYLHPLTGGEDGRGWPWGRDVYVSEIYALLDAVSGVDYVTRTSTTDADGETNELDELTVESSDAWRRVLNEAGDLVAIKIRPDELVRVRTERMTTVPPGR